MLYMMDQTTIRVMKLPLEMPNNPTTILPMNGLSNIVVSLLFDSLLFSFLLLFQCFLIFIKLSSPLYSSSLLASPPLQCTYVIS